MHASHSDVSNSFVTPPWAIAHQAPLSTGFCRQNHWNGPQFLLPGNLPDPQIKPTSPAAPALAGEFFTTEPPVSSYKDINPIKVGPAFMASIYLNYFLIPNIAALRVRASAYKFWEHGHSIHNNIIPSIPHLNASSPIMSSIISSQVQGHSRLFSLKKKIYRLTGFIKKEGK